jgi:hypothetical protein
MGIVGCNAAAFAEGPTRPPTAVEKQYYDRVINTIVKAIPAGPSGWSKTGQTKFAKLTEVSMALDDGLPFEVDYMISWKNVERLQKAEEEIVGKAVDRGITQEDEVTNFIKQNYPHDVAMEIDIIVNGRLYIPPEAVIADTVVGASVLRTEGEFDPHLYWQEGCTYVFLGSFWNGDVSQYRGETPELAQGLPPTQIQSIVINIQADPERTRKVLQQINWASLKGLLNN